jgi:hypothetical protein
MAYHLIDLVAGLRHRLDRATGDDRIVAVQKEMDR